jgi:hypothetical protein
VKLSAKTLVFVDEMEISDPKVKETDECSMILIEVSKKIVFNSSINTKTYSFHFSPKSIEVVFDR